MALFGKARGKTPKLTRQQSLASVPVLNQLITIERTEEGKAILNVPRERTRAVRMMGKLFKLPPYKRIELDELGTYTLELCDGTNTVADVIARFAKKFRLNRREAEVSILTYLGTLAKRGIIAFAVPKHLPQ